jgi:hypothetical protein
MFLAIVIVLAQADSPQGLSREDALAVVAISAKYHGYELKNYKRSTYPLELSKDGKEWTFYYECTPPPVSPGCHFFVSVQRETGAVKFYHGE